ncbi:MAG: TRAP transporter substrate-binding protein [Billgrantia sp.]
MTIHKHFVRSSLTIGLMSTIAFAIAAEARTITVGTVLNARDISTQSMEKWGELLAERTDGRISVNIIPGGTLGGDREHLQQLSSGEIDINLSAPVMLQHVAPEYQCLEAEYIYEDEDHGFAVWRGEIGDEISNKLRESYGIELIGVGRRGARHVTANRAIEQPSDLEGLRFRVTNNLRAEIFSAYGAQPAPLPLSELYGGLRQGVFDAQENPLATIHSFRFHEVQSHINLTEHVWTYNLVAVNSDFYNDLGDDREVVQTTLDEAMEWLYDAVEADNQRIRADIEDSGSATFVEPDIAAFRQMARPILLDYAEQNCRPGLIDDVDNIVLTNAN